MEMTLRLPSSYVDVERDEMEYVDGGWSANIMSNRVFGAAINTTIGLAIGGAGLAAISSYVGRVGAYSAGLIFTKCIASKLRAVGCAAFVASAAWAVNFAINYLDVGGAVARKIDSIDARPNNGWLSIGW